ncbi:hypothetical protein ABZS63_41000, partial [Streptomyces sp. NPDC005568]
MRQFTAIVNPSAGGSTSAAALLQVARLLREAGAELETEYSRSLTHVTHTCGTWPSVRDRPPGP